MFGLVVVIVLMFGLGAVLGAPFVPSHHQSIEGALDLMALAPGQRLLDLGAGSGTMVLAAARRGLDVTGIEINPLLWLIANLRLWPYRRRARVKLGNYWQMDWPIVDGIYLFLIGHYMPRLAQELPIRLNHPVVIVSNTFEIPGLLPHQTQAGVYKYDFVP